MVFLPPLLSLYRVTDKRTIAPAEITSTPPVSVMVAETSTMVPSLALPEIASTPPVSVMVPETPTMVPSVALPEIASTPVSARAPEASISAILSVTMPETTVTSPVSAAVQEAATTAPLSVAIPETTATAVLSAVTASTTAQGAGRAEEGNTAVAAVVVPFTATIQIPSKPSSSVALPATKDGSSDLSDPAADTSVTSNTSGDPTNSSDAHATTINAPAPINANEGIEGDAGPQMGRGARNKKGLARQTGSVAAKKGVAQQMDSVATGRPRRELKRKAEEAAPGAPNGRSQLKRR